MFVEILWNVVGAILLLDFGGFLLWMAVHDVKQGEIDE